VDKLRTALAVAFLVCAVSITAVGRQPSPSQHRHRQRAHHARRVSKKQPAMSATVVTATFVDELQPTPSAIAMYQDGRLALTAQDVPLGDILERIGESTGAVIEAPVLEERVSVQLDPQPPVQAIAALFEGMHLNYAILGGTSDQDPLQQIIVTLKAAPGSQSDVPNRGLGVEGTAVEAGPAPWLALPRRPEATKGYGIKDCNRRPRRARLLRLRVLQCARIDKISSIQKQKNARDPFRTPSTLVYIEIVVAT